MLMVNLRLLFCFPVKHVSYSISKREHSKKRFIAKTISLNDKLYKRQCDFSEVAPVFDLGIVNKTRAFTSRVAEIGAKFIHEPT